MFGGFGLYRKGGFFGILHAGRLYFKTDDASRGDYLALGMKPFRPKAGQTLRNYYEVPVEVVEDAERLQAWALRASDRATPPRRGRSAGRRRDAGR